MCRRIAALIVLLLGPGCSASTVLGPPVRLPALAIPLAPAVLPALVVSTPATRLTTGGPAPIRLARVRARLPLRVLSVSPDGAEVLVATPGDIEVTGLAARDRLGVLICEAGPLGDHFYAGAGNLLTLRSLLSGGRVRVAGEVLVRATPHDPKAPWARQFRRIPFEADIDERRLCRATPPKRHAGTDTDPEVGTLVGEVDIEDFPAGTALIDVGKDTPLALLNRPGGAALHTRPGDTWGYSLALLRRDGEWDLVASGDGPYLAGWVPRRPSRQPRSDVLGILGALAGGALNGPLALHTTELARHPLHELPAGAVVQQRGVPFARVRKPGWARVSGQRDGWVFVVAAVDGGVVVEGWMDPRQLGRKVQGP